MSETIKNLLGELIAEARQRGISQASLADAVGITGVGLSKAKARGDIRASTLAALAAQVGLELVLVPSRTREQAAEAIKAGTFFRTPTTSDED